MAKANHPFTNEISMNFRDFPFKVPNFCVQEQSGIATIIPTSDRITYAIGFGWWMVVDVAPEFTGEFHSEGT